MAGNLEAQKLEEEIRELKTELQVLQKFIKQCEEELRAKISGKEKELEQLSKQAEEDLTAEISVNEISGKEISGKEKEHEKKEKEIGKTGEMGKWGKLKRKLRIGEDAIPEAVQTETRNLQTEEQDFNEKMDEKQRDIKEKEIEINCMKKEMENGEGENKDIMEKQVELQKKEMELHVMKDEMENMKMNKENSCLKKQLAISSLQEKEKEQGENEFRLKELKAKSEREKSRLGLDKNKLNYAVTGGQAAGKSSLINGMLGLGRNSEGAAKTDIVYCTSATSHRHPSLKDVTLWDLPGVGTPDHPEETYYEDTALEAFDAIIILTSDRILDIELKIAKRSQEAKKRVVFVRSKADKSIREICIDQKITMAEAAKEFRKKVEENFKKELKTAKMSGINFLIVSSRAFLSGKSPYTYGDDRSLEGMDEKLVTKFLSETGTSRKIGEDAIPEAVQTEKELEQLLKHSEEGKWGKLKRKLGIGEKEKGIEENAIPEAVQTEIRNLQMEEQDFNEKMDAKQREIKEKEIEIDCMKNEMENSEAENKETVIKLFELRMELRNMKDEMENMKLNKENSCLKKQLAISSLQEKEKEQEKSEFRLKELKAISEREKSRLGLDKNKFNYAVIGGQAAGKSSLINGLLGLGRNSEGAAKTDIVYCTSATSQYRHPSLKDVILWDLPGVGTPDHPEETYYEDTALEAFNAIIILTGDRIPDIELKIAIRSQKAKKRVVFVRSKADKCIREICIDQKITMAEAAQEFRKKVEENFKKELKTAKMSGINILIVSSRAFLPSKSPYTYLDDRSLKGMDEELVTKFLSETGAGLV